MQEWLLMYGYSSMQEWLIMYGYSSMQEWLLMYGYSSMQEWLVMYGYSRGVHSLSIMVPWSTLDWHYGFFWCQTGVVLLKQL